METAEQKRTRKQFKKPRPKSERSQERKLSSVQQQQQRRRPEIEKGEFVEPPPPQQSPTSPRVVIREATDREDGIKRPSSQKDQLLSSGSMSSSTSREKLIYKHHNDGFINENKRSFESVDFCFFCDTRDPLINQEDTFISAVSSSTSATKSLPPLAPIRRPRSTSDLTISKHKIATISSSTGDLPVSRFKLGLLRQSVEKTGYRLLATEGQMPVYRTVFLCPLCVTKVKEAKSLDINFYLRITENALAYF